MWRCDDLNVWTFYGSNDGFKNSRKGKWKENILEGVLSKGLDSLLTTSIIGVGFLYGFFSLELIIKYFYLESHRLLSNQAFNFVYKKISPPLHYFSILIIHLTRRSKKKMMIQSQISDFRSRKNIREKDLMTESARNPFSAFAVSTMVPRGRHQTTFGLDRLSLF